ncbi:MAG TPA: cytochrome P460 [Gammaproteobacteria bacterium]|nr:cytochrome P460 [Gammaproteobacteria bacterium]
MLVLAVFAISLPAFAVEPAPNGITLPDGYQDWRVIASSQRDDNSTMRVILGNDIAVAAARAGKTNPWPEGAVLAKLVWKNESMDKWPAALVPGKFVHAEFMVRDSTKWPETGGWGFARWIGMEQKPYGKNAGFVEECFGCHQPVKDRDFVFTRPAMLPDLRGQ